MLVELMDLFLHVIKKKKNTHKFAHSTLPLVLWSVFLNGIVFFIFSSITCERAYNSTKF